tara:strand:- start:930 stop:1196 length:267 start_codon:yes stop_codon:yes gene_type:complete
MSRALYQGVIVFERQDSNFKKVLSPIYFPTGVKDLFDGYVKKRYVDDSKNSGSCEARIVGSMWLKKSVDGNVITLIGKEIEERIRPEL